MPLQRAESPQRTEPCWFGCHQSQELWGAGGQGVEGGAGTDMRTELDPAAVGTQLPEAGTRGVVEETEVRLWQCFWSAQGLSLGFRNGLKSPQFSRRTGFSRWGQSVCLPYTILFPYNTQQVCIVLAHELCGRPRDWVCFTPHGTLPLAQTDTQ